MNQATIDILKAELRKQGITNAYAIDGVIAVVQTEHPNLGSEQNYSNTPVDRIRFVFKDKVKAYTDAQLEKIKKSPVDFFEIVYGGQYGNTTKGDGYKYRARGFNGLTFKDNYDRIGKAIGVDLVGSPDLLNQEVIAARAMAAYFALEYKAAARSGLMQKKIGVSDSTKVTSVAQGTKLALQANAGFGKNIETPFYKGVYEKALATIKENPVASTIVTIVFIATVFF